MKYPVPEKIKKFSSVFADHGFKLYIVGGAVRDYLLGRANADFDFCTDALPEEVISMFHRVIPTGIKHGTVTVLFCGESFEVTTFRTEGSYSDNRHPDSVSFVRNLSEDLSRRDFTINAFAADCNDGSIIDLFDGMKDLKDGIIRAIGNPTERFEEDALRMMRLARFCAKLGFEADKDTKKAAKALSKNIENVSQERIYDELSKTLSSSNPTLGLMLLEETDILFRILPELEACKSTEQHKVGCSNVLEHTYLAVEAAAKLGYSLEVRLALLLHDIGKPECLAAEEIGTIHFYCHEKFGAKMAKTVLKRLKCSNALIDKVTILIENHMVTYRDNWTDGAVKRFINRVGKDNINELFELQWCDQIASEGKAKTKEYDVFIKRIQELENQPLTIKDLAVTGDDLNRIGIPRSRIMGFILQELLEAVLDDEKLNTKKALLEKARLILSRINQIS